MSTYKFKQPPPRPTLGPLPEGDYNYTVTDCQEPYESNAGNSVLPIKLAIEPDDTPVFANPWTGYTSSGDFRDNIAEFLVSCNRAPAEGAEPNWARVIGAKGRCHLKVEIAAKGNLAGKEVNKVGWFYAPKQLEKQTTFTKEEYDRLRKDMKQLDKEAIKDSGQAEPDDIPF